MRHSALSLGAQGNEYLEAGDWLGSVAYRWMRSDRHFRGDREEPDRQENGTEVINDIHSFDLTATYALSQRFSLSFTLPFVDADRSSLYEHDRTNRHNMHAGGLGDLRLLGTAWLLDPNQHTKQNIALGLGLKAPTGDYEAMDIAFRATGPVRRPVDQSIQPGDGGWGMILELSAYQTLFKHTYAYAQGSYLFNPRDKNGVETTTSRPGNVTIMSVPDQYMGRAGVSYLLWPAHNLTVSLGGRIEGVPVRDVFGGSDGFRRPGFSIGIEPGVSVTWRKFAFSLSAPVAIERNRERSVLDLRRSKQTGTDVHGDAAFADFLIIASLSRRF